MARKKIATAPARVASHRHKDTRKNIPTEELRDFVREEEQQPKKILYPRNPDLDPQLVWRGKDEQDSAPLEVPAVPIYIQEKVHPQAIIEDFTRGAAKTPGSRSDPAENLFADFNGLPEEFDQRVDFYHHEGHWSNRLILGDSLLVMTSLAEKEALKGKVQMIYLDPPYGIKFGSNWQVSTRKRDVKDGKAEYATRQPEQVKAFRDTWKLGIHSYLAYLRDRLTVAHELLTETGSIFVQIGDENVHLVRSVLDEVFGSENFVSFITVKKTNPLGAAGLGAVSDYVLWYARNAENYKFRRILLEKKVGRDGVSGYSWVEQPDGARRRLQRDEIDRIAELPADQRLFAPTKLTAAGLTPSCVYPFEFAGKTWTPRSGTSWRTNSEGMKRVILADRLIPLGDAIYQVMYFDDYPVTELTNLWADTRGEMEMQYVVQTSRVVVERCLLMATDPGDLVLDPTCGSGTTAYVAEQWGRRWITVDSSRVALTLARTRLMAGRFPYYLLADSAEGAAKDLECGGTTPLPGNQSGDMSPHSKDPDIRKGFVYKRVPHVTLKSIANNPDITEGMTREQIDAAIMRHADTETLYDQPYEDKKRVRVTGPFTVESLSPHRTISAEEKVRQATVPDGDGRVVKVVGPDHFGRMILDNLRTAGVQNTVKGQRLKFDSLESYAGQWIHADGRYTEGDGKEKRAAVCIGPEHGTVGTQLIKEAAKEAVRGVGFDVLIVCGFAFDPSVSEEAKRYGKLTVLAARMNPDLAMGELLKKTGSANLFMVFGEPDIEISTPDKDGRVTVEVRGLDVYDPTTGDIRSSGTDDIACWFIDTDYNGESFFVRHAYFTGADEPYEKLKRALRAEIDEAAWGELYSTKSRPFPKPDSGKIAVKVINHYGDEVLKVYEV